MENIEIELGEILPFGPIEMARDNNIQVTADSTNMPSQIKINWAVIIGIVVAGGVIYAVIKEREKRLVAANNNQGVN